MVELVGVTDSKSFEYRFLEKNGVKFFRLLKKLTHY